jgi:hypothetical protein
MAMDEWLHQSSRDWMRYLVSLSQITVVLGSVLAVVLLLRLAFEDTLPSTPGIFVGAAENWAEIKNSVPELNSAAQVTALKRPETTLDRSGEVRNTPATDDQVPGSPQIIRNLIQPLTERSLSQAPETASAATNNPFSEVNLKDAVQVEALVTRPEAVPQPRVPLAVASPEDANSNVTASVATPPVPSSRTMDRRRDTAAAVQPPRQEVADQKARSRAPRSLSDGPRTTKAKQLPKPPTERALFAQRTSPAAAGTQGPQITSAPPASSAGAADPTRNHLLGIPLPTGSEIKQCLLEFRC